MKMMFLKYSLGLCATVVCLFVSAGLAQGQAVPGVTDKEILIGSCSALEGPSHFLGTETVTGAKAYLDMINDAGGATAANLSSSPMMTATTQRRPKRASIAREPYHTPALRIGYKVLSGCDSGDHGQGTISVPVKF